MNRKSDTKQLLLLERIIVAGAALILSAAAVYLVMRPGQSVTIETSAQRTPKGSTRSVKTTSTLRDHKEAVLLLGGAAAVLFVWGVNGSRLTKVSMGGASAEMAQYGASAADKQNLDRSTPLIDAEGLAQGTCWDKTGDLFWLGNDLMWATDVLQRQGSPAEIWMSITQSLHHARQLAIQGNTIADLEVLATEAAQHIDAPSYWTLEKRHSVSLGIRKIANDVGAIAAARQGDSFLAWDDAVRPFTQG